MEVLGRALGEGRRRGKEGGGRRRRRGKEGGGGGGGGDKEKEGERGVRSDGGEEEEKEKEVKGASGVAYMELSAVADEGSSHLNPSLHLHEGVQNLLQLLQ